MKDFPEIDKHFIVPEGYFGELFGNVMQKIDGDDVARLKSRVVFLRRIAVAASVVAVVAIGALLYGINAHSSNDIVQEKTFCGSEINAHVITIPRVKNVVDNTIQTTPSTRSVSVIGQNTVKANGFVADNSASTNAQEQSDLFTDEDAVDFIYVNTQSIQMIVDPEEL